MRWGLLGLSVLFSTVLLVSQFWFSDWMAVTYEQEVVFTETDSTVFLNDVVAEPSDTRLVVNHQPLPESVKLIYMSACVAGTPDFRQSLVELIEDTELNAVMIDVKDYSGTISFPVASTSSWSQAWQAAECGAPDMRDFIADLHERGIYVVGRITVFQDPFYAPRNPDQAVLRSDQETVWADYKGLSFVDVAATDYWKEVVELSVLAYNLGFDELNYDYVRYPSDGDMADIYFPQSQAGTHGSDKAANLEAFFTYLAEAMADESRYDAVRHVNTGRTTIRPWLSADVFGMTTSSYDDLSIGQILERAVPYFDFVAPMVYPSHYPSGFLGGRNPNDYPYEVVYNAMRDGVDRLKATTTPVVGFLHQPLTTTTASSTTVVSGVYVKQPYVASRLRTWIQDFDYGGEYDAADVRAQIQASYDAGVNDWMIWAPSNRYTRAALYATDSTEVPKLIDNAN